MNKNIKIDLTSMLGTNYKNFGLILTDHQPAITWNNPKHKRSIYTNLWYPIELGQIPDTYDEYLREKLAVTDPVEAQQIIDDWNTKYISTPLVTKQFNVRFMQFAVLELPEFPDKLLILGTNMDRPKNYKSVGAGSGGYVWQRLPDKKLLNDSAAHDLLTTHMGLRLKRDRVSFIYQWNK